MTISTYSCEWLVVHMFLSQANSRQQTIFKRHIYKFHEKILRLSEVVRKGYPFFAVNYLIGIRQSVFDIACDF